MEESGFVTQFGGGYTKARNTITVKVYGSGVMKGVVIHGEGSRGGGREGNTTAW